MAHSPGRGAPTPSSLSRVFVGALRPSFRPDRANEADRTLSASCTWVSYLLTFLPHEPEESSPWVAIVPDTLGVWSVYC